MHVPDGFAQLTPYFFVAGAETFAAFLGEAFGGTEIGRTVRANGVIANLQLRIGTSTVMISESSDRYPPMPAAFYLYVEDAHAAMKRAIAAGGRCEMEVTDMDYGDRQGGIRDPFGNIWWVSQRLIDAPYYA